MSRRSWNSNFKCVEASIRFFQSLTRLALAVVAFFQTHLCKQLSWRIECMQLGPRKWLTKENVADCVTIKIFIYIMRIWVLCKNTKQLSIPLSLPAYKWTIESFIVIWYHLILISTFDTSLVLTRKKLWLPWCGVLPAFLVEHNHVSPNFGLFEIKPHYIKT
jgi:hypothetical protein